MEVNADVDVVVLLVVDVVGLLVVEVDVAVDVDLEVVTSSKNFNIILYGDYHQLSRDNW